MMAFDSDSVTSSICHSAVTHTQSHSDSWCPCNTQGVILIQTFSLPPSFVVHILSVAHTYSLLLSQTHSHTVCLIFLIGYIPCLLSHSLHYMTYTNMLTVVVINHTHTHCSSFLVPMCNANIIHRAKRSAYAQDGRHVIEICHAHYLGARTLQAFTLIMFYR